MPRVNDRQNCPKKCGVQSTKSKNVKAFVENKQTTSETKLNGLDITTSALFTKIYLQEYLCEEGNDATDYESPMIGEGYVGRRITSTNRTLLHLKEAWMQVGVKPFD